MVAPVVVPATVVAAAVSSVQARSRTGADREAFFLVSCKHLAEPLEQGFPLPSFASLGFGAQGFGLSI